MVQFRTYLTMDEKREVIRECGDSAVILYEFYVSKQNTKDYDFSDSKASRAIGWSREKVQRIRLKLEKYSYFKRVKDHNTYIFYIGKDAVLGSVV